MLLPYFYFFLLSGILDIIWQNAHVFLYAHYKGGAISEFILLRAVLFDAITMLLILLIFKALPAQFQYLPLFILLNLIAVILIEYWGLSTGRWAYNEMMPIIPILNVGLTPILQLPLLGYFTYWVIFLL